MDKKRSYKKRSYKKRSYKKHRYTNRRYTKRSYTKRHHKKHRYTKLHRKHKEISIVPGSQSIPIFTAPNKKKSESIVIDIQQPSGNIIPGLRNYIKNM